jgi:hypothetical protein
MLRLSTECNVMRAHPQCVDILAIRKIASVEDGRLEIDVNSASNSMAANDHHKALRGPSLGTVPTIVRYHMSFSTAAIMVLSLAGVRTATCIHVCC